MAMSRFAKDLLNRIEILEEKVKVLQDNCYALYKRLEEQEVTVIDTPNPTTEWGGKDNAEKKC